MSKRLILHIGFHETQTTVIQESMFGFRVGLRDHNVIYPQPLSGHPSHLDLATALGFNPRPDELSEFDGAAVIERYRRLVEDSPPNSTVVLSSEEFCQGNFRLHAVENLQLFVDKVDVETTIVAYVRDPLQFLLAIYHHELRDTDSTRRFAEWVEGFDLSGADFVRRLDPWREAFGDRAEIRIRDFDAIRAEGVPTLVDFLDTSGIGPIDMLSVEHPVAEIHPSLVEALIAVRNGNVKPGVRQDHFESLLEISALMAPVDAAELHLGAESAAELANRLTELATSRYAEQA